MAKELYKKGHTARRPSKWSIMFLSFFVVAAALIGVWFLKDESVSAPKPIAGQVKTQPEPAVDAPTYKPVNLQPTVDTWLANQKAKYYISIYDAKAKKTVASNKPDESLFAASLYKIYVAYLALLDIQNNKINPDLVISGSYTYKQCIDKMIRESYSPCGEAIMADIGQTTLNARVKKLGMTGTTFNGITTSARDSALILQYIDEKRDLNSANTNFLRDAMLTQPSKYKLGLQSGSPEAKWETKVGWNETLNYHDIGIMTLKDGRVYYVAILSQGNGSSKPIADFSRTIYVALTK